LFSTALCTRGWKFLFRNVELLSCRRYKFSDYDRLSYFSSKLCQFTSWFSNHCGRTPHSVVFFSGYSQAGQGPSYLWHTELNEMDLDMVWHMQSMLGPSLTPVSQWVTSEFLHGTCYLILSSLSPLWLLSSTLPLVQDHKNSSMNLCH
jgi:hypothetical protein